MGFLQDLGIGDLLSSVRDMSDEITSLKDDVLSSVSGPVEDLKNSVQDITGGLGVSDVLGDGSGDDASN